MGKRWTLSARPRRRDRPALCQRSWTPAPLSQAPLPPPLPAFPKQSPSLEAAAGVLASSSGEPIAGNRQRTFGTRLPFSPAPPTVESSQKMNVRKQTFGESMGVRQPLVSRFFALAGNRLQLAEQVRQGFYCLFCPR